MNSKISEECEIFLKLTQKLQNHLQNPSLKCPSQESSSSSSQDISLYAPTSIKQLNSEIEKCEKDIKNETKSQKKLQNKLKKFESIQKSLKEELALEDIRKNHITQRIEVTLPYASQLQNQLSLSEKSISQSSYYIKSLCLQCETEKRYLDIELNQISQLKKTISSLLSNKKKFSKYK
jgi:septal ring factor EnvC (AmiA/AmiB activator)